MRRRWMAGALEVVITAALVGGALAQPQSGRGGGRAGGGFYDAKTVETVRGDVVGVEKVARGRGPYGGGVHVSLKTDKETLDVHLGPAWYLDREHFRVAPKEQLQVRGSRVTWQGRPALIAAEVRKGSHALKLRDENGLPVWRGRRSRGQGN